MTAFCPGLVNPLAARPDLAGVQATKESVVVRGDWIDTDAVRARVA